MSRPIYYVSCPLRPTDEEVAADTMHPTPYVAALESNLLRAMAWLAWLRRSFPEVTFVAPWIASVVSGDNDRDPAQREAGLVDAEALIPLLAGIVLCGGRTSSGMARERRPARRVVDATGLGARPPGIRPGGTFEAWAAALEVPA